MYGKQIVLSVFSLAPWLIKDSPDSVNTQINSAVLVYFAKVIQYFS